MIILNLYVLFTVSLLLGLIRCPYARAAASSTSITQVPDLKKAKDSRQGFSFRFFSTQYTQYEAQYLYDQQSQSSAQKVQLLFGGFNTPHFNYLALPEAYYESQVSFVDYSLGRKRSVTNKLDDIFHLGILNPYFSMDYINYVPEGQVGLHTNIGNETLKLGVNYYPIFIPNQSPMIKEKDGRLISPTPWGPRPPESFVYNGEASPIRYAIDDYNLGDIVQHDGYGLSLSTGSDWQNWQIRVSYSDSPINEIVLSRLVITDMNLNSDVTIYPVVRTSEKIASDISWQQNNVTYSLSYLADRPRNTTEAERSVQGLEPLTAYGGGIQVEFSPTFNAGVNYAQFNGGEIIDRREDGSASPFTIYNSRLLYFEPLAFNASYQASRFLFHANWIYDRVQSGSLFSFKTQYSPWRRMRFGLGFDVLGVSKEQPSKKYFLSEHAADDRLTGEMQYAF